MDRFYWSSSLNPDERTLQFISNIRIYDGDKKTSYEDGHLILTNIRLLWRPDSDSQSTLALDLSLIILIEEEQGGFASSPKIVVHLSPFNQINIPRPVNNSKYTFIKFSFRHGGMPSFKKALDDAISCKEWKNVAPVGNKSDMGNVKQLRTGILGIERGIHAKHKETRSNISKAFEDLKNLMSLAKEMVNLSSNISKKIKEQTGEISSDEAVQLRSYLLSLGIDDPVTKEAVGSTTEYHKRLAQEICDALQSSIEEVGGVMLLSEVYCRINRARGLQLLSPEDVLNACSLMAAQNLPLKLFTFNSGVQILQLSKLDESEVPKFIIMSLEENEEHGISAIELANSRGMPLLLAQERLHHAEELALAVRDDSEEGLRFFPNLFFENQNVN